MYVALPRGERVPSLILADLATDDQQADGALGGVVVGGHARGAQAGQQFVVKVPEAPRQCPAGMVGGGHELGAQRRHRPGDGLLGSVQRERKPGVTLV